MDGMSELRNDSGILVKQKYLPMGFMSACLMIMTTIQWVILDMYLPALPALKEEFGTTEAMLNISLNAGMVMSAVGTLICGPISDKLGRKPVLLGGLFISMICVFACTFSQGIVFLSVMRGICGLGEGAAVTTATAIIRDSFTGRRFETTMTVLQSVAAVAPIVAPALGGFIIDISSWRYIFVFLAAATLVTILPLLFFSETCIQENRSTGGMKEIASVSGSLLKDKGFMLFIGIMALVTIPIWAYIAVSSYVFIEHFGLGNVTYGIYYGTGAALSCLAPLCYLLLIRKLRRGSVVVVTILLTLGGGLIVLGGGHVSPVIYMLGVLPLMLAEGVLRPLGLVVLLEGRRKSVGTVSSIIQFILNLIGIFGTTLATLAWSSMILGTAVISLGCGVLAAGAFLIVVRKGYMKDLLW